MSVALMTDASRKQLESVFTVLDRDGDSRISAEELKQSISHLGIYPSELEIADMMTMVDRGNKHYLDFSDMVDMMQSAPHHSGNDEDDCKLAFACFNKSGSGEITRDELFAALNALGENVTGDEIDDLMKEADVDLDKRVSFLEFMRVLRL